jgi:hypothetical protein
MAGEKGGACATLLPDWAVQSISFKLPRGTATFEVPRLHFLPFWDPLAVALSSPFGPFVGRSFAALLLC